MDTVEVDTDTVSNDTAEHRSSHSQSSQGEWTVLVLQPVGEHKELLFQLAITLIPVHQNHTNCYTLSTSVSLQWKCVKNSCAQHIA